MAEVKWIKIVTDIFDDEKVLLIESMPQADSIIVIWFKLLCLAGKQNNNGVFLLNDRIAYTDEMLATVFRRPINTVRLALSTFEQYGMIDVIDNVITIPSWERHQNIEGMDRIREQNRIRKANQRARLAEQCDSHVTVTQCHAVEEDKNKIREEKTLSNESKAHPTPEEVTAYSEGRIDGNHFCDYYAAQGWKLSNGQPMKDWKAAVRNWMHRDAGKKTEDAVKGKLVSDSMPDEIDALFDEALKKTYGDLEI